MSWIRRPVGIHLATSPFLLRRQPLPNLSRLLGWMIQQVDLGMLGSEAAADRSRPLLLHRWVPPCWTHICPSHLVKNLGIFGNCH